MISQIYVEERDKLLCRRDGFGDRYSVEVDPDYGVPFRVLLSERQLRTLHQNIGDALEGRPATQVRLGSPCYVPCPACCGPMAAVDDGLRCFRCGNWEAAAPRRPVAEAVVDADDLMAAMAEGFEPRMTEHD